VSYGKNLAPLKYCKDVREGPGIEPGFDVLCIRHSFSFYISESLSFYPSHWTMHYGCQLRCSRIKVNKRVHSFFIGITQFISWGSNLNWSYMFLLSEMSFRSIVIIIASICEMSIRKINSSWLDITRIDPLRTQRDQIYWGANPILKCKRWGCVLIYRICVVL